MSKKGGIVAVPATARFCNGRSSLFVDLTVNMSIKQQQGVHPPPPVRSPELPFRWLSMDIGLYQRIEPAMSVITVPTICSCSSSLGVVLDK
jgi:hypothetical protein